MKIGFTYDLKSDWSPSPGEPHDANAEFDKPQTVDAVCKAIESGGHEVIRIGNVHQLMARVNDLDVDIVFNICEGRRGRNRESQVPLFLEMHSIPFVGADALTLGVTLDKTMAKKCFIADGVPTARFFVAHDSTRLAEQNFIGFPLIVKTIWEGSSKGISDQSRVDDEAGLRRQVDLINQVYQQPALVEEFISGSECTVAVLGNNPPEAMPVVQISINGSVKLGREIYTHDRIYSDNLKYVCPAQFPDALTRKIQDCALRAYQAVGCRDFGRVDFRINEKGAPFVLEINPLPVLGLDDIFPLFPKVIGTTYEGIINRIINHAAERYQDLVAAGAGSQIQEGHR